MFRSTFILELLKQVVLTIKFFTMETFNTTIDFSIHFSFVIGLFLCVVAAIVSYISYPIIIKVSNVKELMGAPNQRDVHVNKTPNLGGVGIFFTVSLVISFLGNYFQDEKILNLLGAMTIMFFIGLVDDLIDISPKSKLLGQILVSLSIVFLTDVRIESLQGILGIYELPYIVSTMLTVFVFLTIINAYNLIDGVDGLAGSFTIIANVFFSVFYFLSENYFMFFLSVGLVGALISFLIFNFSKERKIFMGDTGSMVIGFILAYQAIHLTSVNLSPAFAAVNPKILIYVMAIFSFPLLDTTRVFVIRLKSGKSPFTADNNHIHHTLLSYGLKHWEVSLVASIFTVSMISGVYFFNNLGINELLFVLLAMWMFSILIVSNINITSMLTQLVVNQKNNNEVKFDTMLESNESNTTPLKKLA